MSGYQFTNVASIEPVSAADGMLKGNIELYNVISGCAPTYSASNMTVNCAAGSITHFGNKVTVAGGAAFWTLVADSSNPRWTWLAIDSAGAAVVVSGTAAATPSVPTLGDRTAIALVKVEAAQTVAANIATKIDKRVPFVKQYISNTAQSFVESSGYKGFFLLGAPSRLSYPSSSLVGSNFTTYLSGSSATSGSSTGVNAGTWLLSGIAGYSILSGPYLYYQNDWTLVGRIKAASYSDQALFFGAKTTLDASDENNIIGFRLTNTGNLIGVCDSGGTETTRDSGVTIATERTVRIEVRENGTIVRFYVDNAQVGADVTTNIPTGTLYCVVGSSSVSTTRELYVSDVFGWREI